LIEFLVENPGFGVLAIFTLICVAVCLAIRWFILRSALPMVSEREKHGLTFREVGPISPEQYEVFFNGHEIGYVRYRFGCWTAEFPANGGWCIFEKALATQSGQMTDLERGKWLPVIARRFRNCLKEEKR
jgi:hypothetical protein